MKLTLVLFMFVLLFVLKTDDTQQTDKQIQTLTDQSTQKNQDVEKQKNQSNDDEKTNNTSNDVTEKQNDQQNTLENEQTEAPKFVDKEVEDAYQKRRRTRLDKKNDKKKTSLVHEQSKDLFYQKDYRKNEILVSQLNAPIELNKEYQIKSSATYALTEDNINEILMVHVTNQRYIRYIKIIFILEDKILAREFVDETKDMQIPISVDVLKKFKGGYIEFVVKKHFKNVVKITQQKTIEMEFGQNVNLKTLLVDKLLFDIKASNQPVNTNQRYQFILQTDLDEVDLQGDERVDFYVNFNGENPTIKKHDFRASGNIGHGLIKTINKNSKYFCKQNECHYKVLMILENIDKVSFFPSEFPNESVINFQKNMHLIEELEKKEIVTYVIEVPHDNSNWVFRKVPTQEDINFYVNPEVKPNSLDQYMYKASERGAEDMIITQKELRKSNDKLTKFYLTFESKSITRAAVFEFKIYKLKNQGNHQMKLNTYQTGVINGNEGISYALDLSSNQKQTYSLNVKLSSINGNSDLYIKSCDDHSITCRFSQYDYTLALKQKKQNNKLYRYSKQDLKQDDGTYLDQILLQFNCMPKDDENDLSSMQRRMYRRHGGMSSNKSSTNQFDNKYFTSESCKFLITVRNRTVDENQKSRFKLIVNGEGDQENLQLAESVTLQQNQGEETTFKIQLDKQQIEQNRFFKLEAIILTGACEIYMSTRSKKPTLDDNEGFIVFQENSQNNIHTFSKKSQISLSSVDDKGELYIRVISKDFSIVEIIPNLLKRFNAINAEKIKTDQVYQRQLLQSSTMRVNRDTYYYYNFYYEFKENPQSNEVLEFTLNSDLDTINFCIQDKKKEVDFNQVCSFYSDMKVLEIDNINIRYQQGDQIAIGVYVQQSTSQFQIFPINFSLTMTAYKLGQENKKIELFQPGIIFTKKLKSQASLFFSLNLQQIQSNGFIALTAQHIGITANIYLDEQQAQKKTRALANLNHTNFAYEIQNPNSIRWSNKNSKNLFVVIQNTSDKETRFSFVYTYDEIPIQLVEGVGLYLPSNLEHYFIYKQKQKQQSINLNFISEKTQFETFAKIFGRSDIFLNQMKFNTRKNGDYKTDINTKAEIYVDKKQLNQQKGAIVLADYQPKSGYETIYQNQTLSVSNKLTVTFDSGIKQIYPFEYIKNYGYKGEYKYFYFIVDEPQSILVNLVIDSGESDLYINQGKTHPTRTSYWKRSATKKGDQIEIQPSDFQDKNDMIGIYTVGVYSREYSQFELVYVPSQENFYHMKFQKVINLQLEPGQDYYLQFHNKYDSFTTMMYADEDIHVDVLDYNEKNNFDFLTYILDDKNYSQHFEFSKGNPPRVKFLDNASDNLEFFVIKLKVDKSCQFMFCIFDVNKPVEIQSEKRFDLSLDEDQEAIFEVKLDSDYQSADVDVRLKFGDIKFAISDNKEEFNEWDTLNKPNQVYKELMMEKDGKQSDIIIFKQVFIKVKASKLSSFSILVKPKNKYKQLRQFETEMIYTNKLTNQFFYFYVNKKDKETIKSLVFNLHMVQTYNDKPELLFVADDDFSLQGDNSFLPMPIVSVIDKDFDEIKSSIITTQVTQGYYVIKIKQNTEKIPIKISVQINNQKNLDLNGLRKELQPVNSGSKHYYYLYIPEPGHFRVILESCKHVVLKDPVYIEENGSEKQLSLNDDYYEAQKYVQVSFEDQKQSIEHKQIELKLYRGEVQKKGVFRFTVSQIKSLTNNYKNKDMFYEIATEFQPKSQELVLKDYINVFNDDKKKEQTQFTYFFDRNKNLVITFDRPNLKPQLINDFNKVQKIRMFFYLQLDGYTEKLNIRNNIQTCGLSSLNEVKGWNQKTERIVFVNDFSDNERVQFIIQYENLKQFSAYDFLEAFVTMKIHFIENEEDYFGISIDTKTVKLPYFELLIPNSEKKSFIWRHLFFIIIFIVLVYLVYTQVIQKKQKQNTHQRVPTKKGNLELSKITTDPDH